MRLFVRSSWDAISPTLKAASFIEALAIRPAGSKSPGLDITPNKGFMQGVGGVLCTMLVENQVSPIKKRRVEYVGARTLWRVNYAAHVSYLQLTRAPRPRNPVNQTVRSMTKRRPI